MGGREHATASAGDLVCVPACVLHREGTPPEDPADAAVIRLGGGPSVVSVEGAHG